MILNKQRIPVWTWDGTSPSECPECGDPLCARKGEVVVWHWAHKPSKHARTCEYEPESDWHLRWKLAYQAIPGWRIEEPVTIGGKRYFVDAYTEKGGVIKAREFLHSLSARTAEKVAAMKNAGWDVLTIYDGNEFRSARNFITEAAMVKGQKRLLKPRAYDFYKETGGMVHTRIEDDVGGLWKEWTKGTEHTDRWFLQNSPACSYLLDKYEGAVNSPHWQILQVARALTS